MIRLGRRGQLDDRLALVSALRVILGGGVLLADAFDGPTREGTVPLAISYLVVAAAGELVRQRAHRAAVRAAPIMAGADGLFAVLATVGARGPEGPLAGAVLLLIAANAVLISPRVGVGTGLWCAFVLGTVRTGEDLDLWTLSRRIDHATVIEAAISYAAVGVLVAMAVGLRDRTLRRGGERAAALTDLTDSLERADNDEEIAIALATHARDDLKFPRAAVIVRGHDGWHGAAVDTVEQLVFTRNAELGEGAERVMNGSDASLMRTLEPGLLHDVLPGATNVVIAPVLGDHGGIGVIAAEWGGGERERVPVDVVRALETAAAHAGRELERRTQLDEVARLATRDALTGLANRRLFEETLDLELARARREQTPLSLVVLDVDRFKNVNDTSGHRVGDQVLRDVGSALVSLTKAHDLAARYGGDEFVVLLPGCPRSEVVNVAERVREAIASKVSVEGVTASAGVATIPDDATDSAELVAIADAALYSAKHAGRDRIGTPP